MNSELAQVAEQLNRARLRADAWIVWRFAPNGSLQVAASGGLGEQASQNLVANWTGNDRLLSQAVAAAVPARATAEVESTDGRTMSLHLVGLPFGPEDEVSGVLECLFRQADQAEQIFRTGLTEEEQQAIQRHLASPTNEPPAVAAWMREIHEIVAETSGQQRLTSLLNAFCLRYGIDRVLLVQDAGERSRLIGQSGSTRLEDRSEETRRLRQLARTTPRPGASAWNDIPGSDESDHTVACIRLQNEGRQGASLMLLAEQLQGSDFSLARETILEELPVWSLAFQAAVGTVRQSAAPRNGLPLSLIVACALVILLVIPIPLTIQADGQFWPVSRANVYAPEEGLLAVDNLKLPADRMVEKGQPLLTITSRTLELELSQLDGQLATVGEQIRSLRNTRPERSTFEDNSRTAERDVSIRLAELLARQQGLQEERALLLQRLESLTVQSPLSGRILTWDPELKLAGRPVARGQQLLSVGQINGSWEVLADVTDRDLGFFKTAVEAAGGTVQLRTGNSNPKVYSGTLTTLASVLHSTEAGGYVAQAEFSLKEAVPSLLPGQRVTVRVHAGYYPAGYVWFRQAIDGFRTFLTW